MNTQYSQYSYYFVVCGSKCLGVQFEFQFELMATVSNLVSCIVACRSIKSFCVPWWIAAVSKLRRGYVLRHTCCYFTSLGSLGLVASNMDVKGVFLKWAKELSTESDGATRCFDAISSGTSRKLPPIVDNRSQNGDIPKWSEHASLTEEMQNVCIYKQSKPLPCPWCLCKEMKWLYDLDYTYCTYLACS